MTEDSADSSSSDVTSLIRVLRDVGVDALVLRSGAINDAGVFRPLQLLVPESGRRDAVAALDRMAWRYAWVRTGLLRLTPGAVYAWDGGRVVELYWSLPAAPLPASALARLTAALRRSARRGPDGYLLADPSALLVHLAVQSCRPGRARAGDWADFLSAAATSEDKHQVRKLARGAGVRPALDRALAAAAAGRQRPGPGRTYGAGWDVARLVANAMQALAPRSVARQLAGSPIFGDSPIRCRIGGVEVVADPGVFVPAPSGELFLDEALAALGSISEPLVVEAGTGCGAMALAVAKARPDATLHATELSRAAVRSARRNASRLGELRVKFYEGSLLTPLPSSLGGRVDLLMANLPYVPEGEGFTLGALPPSTLTGVEEDGLGLQRQLARSAIGVIRPGGRLQLQMLAWQWSRLSPELAALGYRPLAPRLSDAFAICQAELIAG
ncbi:MAG TPA: methyltransferase [Candidatus Limnocylindria bacterium]|nr:methyltransferase [Candidatus Limnocylindria bacterium]